MKRLASLLSHGTVILSIVMTVLLIVDRINPFMEFLNNDTAKILLALLCGFGLLSGLLNVVNYYRSK